MPCSRRSDRRAPPSGEPLRPRSPATVRRPRGRPHRPAPAPRTTQRVLARHGHDHRRFTELHHRAVAPVVDDDGVEVARRSGREHERLEVVDHGPIERRPARWLPQLTAAEFVEGVDHPVGRLLTRHDGQHRLGGKPVAQPTERSGHVGVRRGDGGVHEQVDRAIGAARAQRAPGPAPRNRRVACTRNAAWRRSLRVEPPDHVAVLAPRAQSMSERRGVAAERGRAPRASPAEACAAAPTRRRA